MTWWESFPTILLSCCGLSQKTSTNISDEFVVEARWIYFDYMPLEVDFKMTVIPTKNLSFDEVSKCKAIGWDGIPTKFLSKTFRSHSLRSIEGLFLDFGLWFMLVNLTIGMIILISKKGDNYLIGNLCLIILLGNV